MEWNVIHTMDSVEWECGAARRLWFCVFVGNLRKRFKHGILSDRIYHPLHLRMPCLCSLHNVMLRYAMTLYQNIPYHFCQCNPDPGAAMLSAPAKRPLRSPLYRGIR
jgi:hypothetical protein